MTIQELKEFVQDPENSEVYVKHVLVDILDAIIDLEKKIDAKETIQPQSPTDQ